jgi:type IV pilus assembly protein PilW
MRTAHIHSRGFGLVEVLVAMVIALLGTIIIFQVFSMSEGIKRTSTSGGDAQQFGALAMFALERDVRVAGYGINTTALLGCSVLAHDALHPGAGADGVLGTADDTTTPTDLPNFTLAPVLIAAGADDKTPDQITLMYGDSDLVSIPPKISQDMPNPAAVFKVSNRYGFVEGDVIIAAEPGEDCTLAQATALPGCVDCDNVQHNSGPYDDANGVSVSARWNKAGGLGVSYTINGSIYNLGAGPARNTYRIANNQLLIDSMFATTTTLTLADNIVHLKVQYGKDNGVNNGTVTNATYVADDGAVDGYSNTMPVTPSATDLARVLSVRMAVVARSAQPEKPNVVGGACDTTTVAPTWSGGTLDLSTDVNWKCYRYRVFETTVPMRNLLWQQT